MSRRRIIYLVLTLLLLGLAARSASWLVIDNPGPSNVIVVLAGEADERPQLGLKLLRQHYAPKLILDVQANETVFDLTTTDVAEHWIRTLPEAQAITICPIYGLSTKEESHESARCIERLGAHTVTLVTSDFHTRRALSTFRHEILGIRFSVAAAYAPKHFGAAWWTHREWAKTTVYEWSRLAWWQCVDRWL